MMLSHNIHGAFLDPFVISSLILVVAAAAVFIPAAAAAAAATEVAGAAAATTATIAAAPSWLHGFHPILHSLYVRPSTTLPSFLSKSRIGTHQTFHQRSHARDGISDSTKLHNCRAGLDFPIQIVHLMLEHNNVSDLCISRDSETKLKATQTSRPRPKRFSSLLSSPRRTADR